MGSEPTKLHALTDRSGRPLDFFMTAGQISDYTGAAALRDSLLPAEWMLADRGWDTDCFRDALEEKGIKSCIPHILAMRPEPRHQPQSCPYQNRQY